MLLEEDYNDLAVGAPASLADLAATPLPSVITDDVTPQPWHPSGFHEDEFPSQATSARHALPWQVEQAGQDVFAGESQNDLVHSPSSTELLETNNMKSSIIKSIRTLEVRG